MFNFVHPIAPDRKHAAPRSECRAVIKAPSGSTRGGRGPEHVRRHIAAARPPRQLFMRCPRSVRPSERGIATVDTPGDQPPSRLKTTPAVPRRPWSGGECSNIKEVRRVGSSVCEAARAQGTDRARANRLTAARHRSTMAGAEARWAL